MQDAALSLNFMLMKILVPAKKFHYENNNYHEDCNKGKIIITKEARETHSISEQ